MKVEILDPEEKTGPTLGRVLGTISTFSSCCTVSSFSTSLDRVLGTLFQLFQLFQLFYLPWRSARYAFLALDVCENKKVVGVHQNPSICFRNWDNCDYRCLLPWHVLQDLQDIEGRLYRGRAHLHKVQIKIMFCPTIKV